MTTEIELRARISQLGNENPHQPSVRSARSRRRWLQRLSVLIIIAVGHWRGKETNKRLMRKATTLMN